MTSIYDASGKNIACTVIEMGPNVVTQVKSVDSDGYNALQIAYGEAKVKRTTKSLQGHFEKAGTTPKKKLVEIKNPSVSKNLGQELNIEDYFQVGDRKSVV